MTWTQRPADASPSWPADELRLRWAGIVVALKTVNGFAVGTVNQVGEDAIDLDTPEGRRSIAAVGVSAAAIFANLSDALELISNSL
jgi:hypothetical protein